ncbi:hypothetical protein CIHG_00516 [Coccidioides immitis H538.4]|uniref:Uncharacterized protein n=2 Tax=Coccidioides immitis TaxID=5501 RepID=A0A0J8QHE1_COCIT|nr:hypothetical protein CISG_00210 [Coccidioides immitis RMSCC 3703]KMU82735.1 hypothetical protein CIHG_00516 [Coccidioides immitis H538.4]
MTTTLPSSSDDLQTQSVPTHTTRVSMRKAPLFKPIRIPVRCAQRHITDRTMPYIFHLPMHHAVIMAPFRPIAYHASSLKKNCCLPRTYLAGSMSAEQQPRAATKAGKRKNIHVHMRQNTRAKKCSPRLAMLLGIAKPTLAKKMQHHQTHREEDVGGIAKMAFRSSTAVGGNLGQSIM